VAPAATATEKYRKLLRQSLIHSRDKLTIMTSKTDDMFEHIFVFFPPDKRIGVQQIKEYVENILFNT
jgi:hypothetical protein